MKKVTIHWRRVHGADGYFMYFSEQSNPLESIGSTTDHFTTVLNRADDAIVNFGVQSFQLQTINGIERRVFGDCAVIQIDLATASNQDFHKTKVTNIVIESQE
jgi:hypothetical protein